MKTSLATVGLALLALGFLPACEDTDSLGPEDQEATLEDELALELLADPSTTATALELADVQTSAAKRKGWAWGSNHGHRTQAELSFRQAADAFAQGDRIRARDKAREGRQSVAQAIELAGGEEVIEGMVERLETLPLFVTATPEVFVNPGKLGLQLGKIAEQARKALHAGDKTRAGALGVLAEQALRHQHRHQRSPISRAEVAVALGEEAIELASRLLGDLGLASDTEHQDILDTAKEFLAQAKQALEAGEDARAAHLAHLAEWWALKAVVLPGGITDEEARAMMTLAEDLLIKAQEAVGTEPTSLQEALLARAETLLRKGEAALGNGTCRGIGALWQSAVISSYLI